MTEAEKAFLAFAAVGVFSIDQRGRIWKHRRLIAGSHGKLQVPPYWKELSVPQRAEKSNSDGYPTVMFSDRTRRHKVFAHRVVWMALNRADIPNGMQVNHKNGVRGDTRRENLEVLTASENTIHGIRVLGRKPRAQNGERNPSAKLTKEQVVKVRSLAGKMSQSQIAAIVGAKQQTISNVINRKTWTHLT